MLRLKGSLLQTFLSVGCMSVYTLVTDFVLPGQSEMLLSGSLRAVWHNGQLRILQWQGCIETLNWGLAQSAGCSHTHVCCTPAAPPPVLLPPSNQLPSYECYKTVLLNQPPRWCLCRDSIVVVTADCVFVRGREVAPSPCFLGTPAPFVEPIVLVFKHL